MGLLPTREPARLPAHESGLVLQPRCGTFSAWNPAQCIATRLRMKVSQNQLGAPIFRYQN